jgi:hypothetical protein
MNTTVPKAAARKRVARYRVTHRRIDYVPDDESLTLIERIRALNPGASYHAVINYLLAEGEKAFAGKAGEE